MLAPDGFPKARQGFRMGEADFAHGASNRLGAESSTHTLHSLQCNNSKVSFCNVLLGQYNAL